MIMRTGTERALGRQIWCSLILLVTAALDCQAFEVSGNPVVGTDGSLRVRGHTLRLWGVEWLNTATPCVGDERPPACGMRAVRALEQVSDGFVRCRTEVRQRDASYQARCFTDYRGPGPALDLAAYLLSRGWVLAASDAPPAYRAMERGAREHRLGIWGHRLPSPP